MSLVKHNSSLPSSLNNSVVVVHWPRLGPYHVARLRAFAELLTQHRLHMVALEISSSDKEYLWENAVQPDEFKRYTLFPNLAVEEAPLSLLLPRLWSILKRIHPSVIVINGYSTMDANILLLWSRMNGCFPILMSESKADDSSKKFPVEWLKGLIVRQFSAALCGGTPHKEYLERLGLEAEKIFDGYDAVDNDFFGERSDMVRQTPEKYRILPGVQDKRPYFLASGRFIARKNYSGLFRAYSYYMELCQGNQQYPWRLVLLGDGPEREILKTEIESLNLNENVTFAGVQTLQNLPAYYAFASVFIHPALQDQWGLVVNEAMACRLPVLVSERAGCAIDLIKDGIEGFKFNPEDVQSLGALMYRMSSGEVDLEGMGQAAHQKISNWGVERFAQGLYRAISVGSPRIV